MRILVVNDELNHQTLSVPRLAHQLARQLVARGHEVTLVGTVRDRRDEGDPCVDGLRTITIYSNYRPRFRAWRGLYNPQTVPAFRHLVARIRPDVVHFHNVHTHLSFACLRVARRSGARVLLTAHDVMLFWDGKLACFDESTTQDDVARGAIDYRYRWWRAARRQRLRYLPFRNAIVRRRVAADVDRLISVSDALGRALAANGFPRSTTIHNGTSPDSRTDPDDLDRFKRRLGLDGHQVVLSGGRLSYLKGMDHLLHAIARLACERVKLLIIGRGSAAYEQHLRALANQLGIGAQVVFAGWIDTAALATAFASSDVCVNPSLCFETLSMFNLEAMMAGKPVVSTFFGGASETIVDGESGLFANPYDVAAMTDRIGTLLRSDALARAMGARGRARALAEFDSATQTAKVCELYG